MQLTANGDPLMADIIDVFNSVTQKQGRLVEEIARVSTSVGREGKMRDRVGLASAGGQWSQAVESVNSLIGGFPADGPQPPILPPRDGFLFLDRDKFRASFAADLPADLAAFMADSQVPWGLDAPAGQVTDPAWRTKPSWYMVTTQDRMIPPAAQRAMSRRAGSDVVEVAGSHAIYISQPAAVADLIKQAATAVSIRQ